MCAIPDSQDTSIWYFYNSSQGLCGSESEVGNSRALPEGSGFPSLYLVPFPGPGVDVTTAYDWAVGFWVLRYNCQGNSNFWLRVRGSWGGIQGGGSQKLTEEKRKMKGVRVLCLGILRWQSSHFVHGCYLRAESTVQQRTFAQRICSVREGVNAGA